MALGPEPASSVSEAPEAVPLTGSTSSPLPGLETKSAPSLQNQAQVLMSVLNRPGPPYRSIIC